MYVCLKWPDQRRRPRTISAPFFSLPDPNAQSKHDKPANMAVFLSFLLLPPPTPSAWQPQTSSSWKYISDMWCDFGAVNLTLTLLNPQSGYEVQCLLYKNGWLWWVFLYTFICRPECRLFANREVFDHKIQSRLVKGQSRTHDPNIWDVLVRWSELQYVLRPNAWPYHKW